MGNEVATRTVRTRDGRELCIEVADAGRERWVLVINGLPNSRHLYGPWIQDAAVRGMGLVSYDRPGYGGSTIDPGHSVADAAADVTAIAEALGVDRLAVWGWSGGGPYALACAALLPDLVLACATLASFAPWGAAGFDYFAGMGQDNIGEIELYFSDPAAAREKSRQDREQALETTADQLVVSLESLLSRTDAAVLTGEFAAWLVRGDHDGLAPGDQGWWDDGAALLSPWGFELESIRVPVKVWHGRHDRFVPFQHGEWLAGHVPGAESALSDADGHLTLVIERIGEVHEWLEGHF